MKKRFVVLRFGAGWIVWDNQKAHIIDGVYYQQPNTAIAVARDANEDHARYDRDWMTGPTDFEDSL